MEKTIVIYKSKYGASAQYAAWIAEELGCRAVSIDEFKKNDLKNYENVIYGGGVQAGGCHRQYDSGACAGRGCAGSYRAGYAYR